MNPGFSRKELMEMDKLQFRAYLHQYAHSYIENQVYIASVLRKELPSQIEENMQELLDIWKERGLPERAADINWIYELLKLVANIRKGEEIDLSPYWQKPFIKRDIEIIRRLIFGRRSIRFWTNDIVLNWTLDEVLKAGLWAPNGGNINALRFIVVREEHQPGLINKYPDLPPAPVHVILCQDLSVYQINPIYQQETPEEREEWRILDCGAAMENMILMAFGLGLGSVWITPTADMRLKIRRHFDLPQHIVVMCILDVGYPNLSPVPPGRISVEDATLARQ